MRIHITILVLIVTALSAQGRTERSIEAVRFSQPPTIDGQITEDLWQLAQPIEGFIQFQPENGQPSALRTVVYIGYGSEALYIAFICYDPMSNEIAAALTKRDSDLRKDDAVIVMLDTFNDDHTCTAFATNSIGTQWDFRVADNGRTSDNNWDASWSSAAVRTADGWSAEFAIPFTSIKFQTSEDQSWGLNLGRSYPRQLEACYWTGPLESETRVSQFGKLTGLNLGNPTKRYEVIPYGLSQVMEDRNLEGRLGLDLRYRINSSLGVDLTINPDFATIEADAEQINLTRFELRYPEKRPFFLEGAELFQQRIRQFYSRRIGDIPWGAKLTGKIGSYDLAIMGGQSQPFNSDSTGLNAKYTVVRAKKSLLGPSSLGFLAANRTTRSDYQGSVGIDGTLFFSKTLGMTTQFVRAHGPTNDGALTWFVRPAFDNATSHFHVRYSHWDKGLMENMNALGFIRDDDRKEFDTNLSHTFWMKERLVESIEADVDYNRYWSQEGILRSWELKSDLDVVFANKWIIELSHNEEYKRYEKRFLNHETTLDVGYDNRAGRSIQVAYSLGRNFDSDLQMLRATTILKMTDAWNISYEMTRLWLEPEPEDPENRSTWIQVLRSNYYFNKDLYVKFFYQVHSAIRRENVQTVVVWRFRPPFGSLQLAYQKGTSHIGMTSDQGRSLFVKLSWVL
ncbi:MAG: carbohydrate binding family 9 domain-containing protein [Candidatus Marinimicrobia bacterium]|nr:carbohydrate binding family 9 domain-containing protein [Candidatus Neomarinimicrobiota bacterium]